MTESLEGQVRLTAPILFKVREAALTECSLNQVNALADYLVKSKKYDLIIEGHASPDGAPINQSLSAQRARVVASHLVAVLVGRALETPMSVTEAKKLLERLANPKDKLHKQWQTLGIQPPQVYGFGELCPMNAAGLGHEVGHPSTDPPAKAGGSLRTNEKLAVVKAKAKAADLAKSQRVEFWRRRSPCLEKNPTVTMIPLIK